MMFEGRGQVFASEIDGRLSHIRRRMNASHLDCCLCADPSNIYYLTNFGDPIYERPYTLIITTDSLDLVVPLADLSRVESRLIGPVELHPYAAYPPPIGARWGDLLRTMIASDSIGVEPSSPAYLRSAISENVQLVEIRSLVPKTCKAS